MGAKAKIEISEEARDVALELAIANGFASADDYVEALLLDDLDAVIAQPWFRAKIAEGEASPVVGPLTAARVHELVQAGIQRAKRRR